MYQVFFYFFMNTTQLTTIFKDGLRRRYAPRNDGRGSYKQHGLRRRYAPRDDRVGLAYCKLSFRSSTQ